MNIIIAVLLSDDTDYFRIDAKSPFRRKVLNEAYSRFAEIGKENKVNVIFTKFNYLSKGVVKEYWCFEKKWKKEKEKIKPDYFFDKFEFGKTENLLKKKLSKNKKIINDFGLESFCKDKWIQAKKFYKIAPKTFLVKNKKDFLKYSKKISSEKIILKPRFGLGGQGIIVLDKKAKLKKKIVGDYVLQELIDTSQGIPSTKIKGIHDLRCVILNGKIEYAYVRQPKKGVLANLHQGGKARMVTPPIEIRRLVRKIDLFVKKFGNRLYSADFFYGNKQFYLIELNSKPGFDFCGRFGYKEIENLFFKEFFKTLK